MNNESQYDAALAETKTSIERLDRIATSGDLCIGRD